MSREGQQPSVHPESVGSCWRTSGYRFCVEVMFYEKVKVTVTGFSRRKEYVQLEAQHLKNC